MKTIKRIWLFIGLVWREWDRAECDFGCEHIYRIDRATAWEVSKIIWSKK